MELLLDAGADPRYVHLTPPHHPFHFAGTGVASRLILYIVGGRIKNKAKLLPRELVDPRNKSLRDQLRKAEFAIVAGDDVVNGDEEGEAGGGSASESE